jgi:predicted RNA-binding Zn ribbon-like protein
MPAKTDPAPPPHDDATPADIRGLLDFLNSRATAKRPERFDTPDHAEQFLAHCDLDYDRRPLTASDTKRLRRLRDALMSAVEQPAEGDPWAEVNEITATVPLHLHATAGPGLTLRPSRDNPADAVIATLLDRLTNLTMTGRWGRLGACVRCRRVFYDSTRSHTRRWCSYATCGNRANVATYRDRNRAK